MSEETKNEELDLIEDVSEVELQDDDLVEDVEVETEEHIAEEEVVVEEVVVLLIEVVVLSTDNSVDVSTVVDEHAIKIIVSKVNNIFLIG